MRTYSSGTMDYQKRKLLTQSVGFLQASLQVTAEFLSALRESEVLTAEDVTTVQRDDTASGKVVELVCLLKRKDNRAYTRFLDVLEQRSCHSAAAIFKPKKNGGTSPDKRTLQLLQTELPDIPEAKLRALALNVVPNQIYKTDISDLTEKLAVANRALESKTLRRSSDLSSSDRSTQGRASRLSTPDSPVGGATNRSGTAKWDIPKLDEELRQMLRDKDMVIQRKDEEYLKLREILDETQTEYQDMLELNSKYLDIIRQLNHMQVQMMATPRQQLEMKALEEQLEQSQAKVSQLESELTTVASEQEEKLKELEKLQRRECKYKGTLNLSVDADEDAIQSRIQDIVESGSMTRTELQQIKTELGKTKQSKAAVEDRLNILMREKEKIEFHMRQQNLTIKKMYRRRDARDTIEAAHSMLTANVGPRVSAELRLPSIDRSLTSDATNKTVSRYCMFCRVEYQPLKPQVCRVHFRALRGGRWTCCKDENHRSAGCLQLPHFYIEITVDKKVLLTDGARYMDIT